MALDCQGIYRIYECIHNITQCKWLSISVYSILYSIYSLSNSLPKHTRTHTHPHLWRWTTAPYNIINIINIITIIIIVIYFIILFVFAVPVLGRWLLISFDEVMRPRLLLWLSLQLPDLPLDPPAVPPLCFLYQLRHIIITVYNCSLSVWNPRWSRH